MYIIPPDVSDPQKLESLDLDFPIGSYEFSRGAAVSMFGDNSDEPPSQPFLGMKMVELNFMVNIKVVDNCITFQRYKM